MSGNEDFWLSASERLKQAVARAEIAETERDKRTQRLNAVIAERDELKARVDAVRKLAQWWLDVPGGYFGIYTAAIRERARDVLAALDGGVS